MESDGEMTSEHHPSALLYNREGTLLLICSIGHLDNEEDIEEDIPLGDPQIPDDIRHLFENVGTVQEIQSLIKNTGDKSKLISMLEEYLHDLKEEASSNNAKSTRNQKEELEKSDAQLVSQLEQALSHI